MSEERKLGARPKVKPRRRDSSRRPGTPVPERPGLKRGWDDCQEERHTNPFDEDEIYFYVASYTQEHSEADELNAYEPGLLELDKQTDNQPYVYESSEYETAQQSYSETDDLSTHGSSLLELDEQKELQPDEQSEYETARQSYPPSRNNYLYNQWAKYYEDHILNCSRNRFENLGEAVEKQALDQFNLQTLQLDNTDVCQCWKQAHFDDQSEDESPTSSTQITFKAIVHATDDDDGPIQLEKMDGSSSDTEKQPAPRQDQSDDAEQQLEDDDGPIQLEKMDGSSSDMEKQPAPCQDQSDDAEQQLEDNDGSVQSEKTDEGSSDMEKQPAPRQEQPRNVVQQQEPAHRIHSTLRNGTPHLPPPPPPPSRAVEWDEDDSALMDVLHRTSRRTHRRRRSLLSRIFCCFRPKYN